MEDPKILLEDIATILPAIRHLACDKNRSVWVFTEHPNILVAQGCHERFLDDDGNRIGIMLLVSNLMAKNLKWSTDDWTKRIVTI